MNGFHVQAPSAYLSNDEFEPRPVFGLFSGSSMQPQTNPIRARRQLDRHDHTKSAIPLIVVSNRQPYRHIRSDSGIDVDRPTGGLTEGLDPVMRKTGGLWVAWGDGEADADVVDSNDCVSVPPDENAYELKRIWLTDEDVDRYYYGLSNRVLWPLCHSFPGKIEYDSRDWERYKQVNEKFANAVVSEYTGTPVVWFQDYHLALAPSVVRSKLDVQATLQQFWHIPWPVWDVYRIVPNSHRLLRGLLGNDRIGFHVQRYCRNFLNCVEAAIPEANVDWEHQQIHYQDRLISVEAIPMGVPVDEIRTEISSNDMRGLADEFRSEHGIPNHTRLGIGVDRLDYTKGVVERLDAIEKLFETQPEWREQFTYVQIASKSRSQIPAYRDVQEDVADAVRQINQEFATDDWDPIVCTTERVPREKLLALYSDADVALVSPLRDGLNLVAQEYVAAQAQTNGVLVLSQNAGIHDYLGQPALSVNPYDSQQFSSTIDTALRMPGDERRRRMRELRSIVGQNDLQRWVDSQLDTVHSRRQVRPE